MTSSALRACSSVDSEMSMWSELSLNGKRAASAMMSTFLNGKISRLMTAGWTLVIPEPTLTMSFSIALSPKSFSIVFFGFCPKNETLPMAYVRNTKSAGHSLTSFLRRFTNCSASDSYCEISLSAVLVKQSWEPIMEWRAEQPLHTNCSLMRDSSPFLHVGHWSTLRRPLGDDFMTNIVRYNV